MSKFLGPIHYWLYDKIGHQEALTRLLANTAAQEGWITDIDDFTRDLPPLEAVIDESNIHGWLQARIADTERRYAALVQTATGQEAARLDRLCEAAFAFGRQNALPAGTSPTEAYQAFENSFVNGMPCDRVNTVTERNSATLSWAQTQELHAEYWTSQGDSVEAYYRLRKCVMDGMLSACALCLTMADKDHYTIQTA